MATNSDGPKVTCLGQVVIVLFILGCLGGAGYLFLQRQGGLSSVLNTISPTGNGNSSGGNGGGSVFSSSGPAVEIGLAYGTEKKRWLVQAVDEFKKTSAGANVTVDLIPMGSVEGAHAVEQGDKRINVWFPASSMYKEQFVTDYEGTNDGKNPILHEDSMALTPMVFIFWKERYEAFLAKYKEVTFNTIGQALQEKSGWDAIAGKPEWGVFKFGHTNPGQSNSGLSALVLMSFEYHNKTSGLTMKDILDSGFQTWMTNIETGTSGLDKSSTGDLVNNMVQRGPSTFDCLFVYESTAIDYLPNATGRWGDPQIVYPKLNMWNDNPYYVLNVPWSTPDQLKASQAFSDFLLSEPIQKEALLHGFRPANVQVPILFPESPFSTFAKYGIQVDIPTVVPKPPNADVLNNLLEGWQRSQGSH